MVKVQSERDLPSGSFAYHLHKPSTNRILHVNGKKLCFYVSGKLAHDLRYANDTDAISLAVMNNNRVVTAQKDLNIVCWNILEGTTRIFDFFCIMILLSYKKQI